MPLTGMAPDIGSQVVARAQTLVQMNILIGEDSEFGTRADGGLNGGGDRLRSWVSTRGLPGIRVNMFLYPTYLQTGTSAAPGNFFIARNYIAWRIVAPYPGQRLVEEPATNAYRRFTPITTPQLLPVGVPISLTIDSGGLYAVAIEWDVTGGTPAANQGYDRVLLSVSAA